MSRLILLPGMGTRSPLLEPQRQAFPTLETPAWVPARLGESLADYAKRLLETIDTTPPFYLGGVSFGGMVALEMARHCEPEAVLLIGSARSGQQVPRAIRTSARVGQRLPMWALALRPRWLIAAHFAWRERFNRHHRALLARAVRGADPELFRWTGGAIARWHFEHEIAAPIHQIHGDKDWILQPPKPGPGIEFIAGGRHMINLTHPDLVNNFLHRHAPEVAHEGSGR
ncbi:MAG: alpha/beta hydrolase [Phycisphaeraceae bacterium]